MIALLSVIIVILSAALLLTLRRRAATQKYTEADVQANVERALSKAQENFTQWNIEENEKILSKAHEEFATWNVEENVHLAEQASDAMKRAIESARVITARHAKATVSGQIHEQFAPFLPEWKWNPKDAHFIGHGIDFLVFDGLVDGLPVTVHMIEIKTGRSRQNTHEKAIEDAVKNNRVTYEVLRIAKLESQEGPQI